MKCAIIGIVDTAQNAVLVGRLVQPVGRRLLARGASYVAGGSSSALLGSKPRANSGEQILARRVIEALLG